MSKSILTTEGTSRDELTALLRKYEADIAHLERMLFMHQQAMQYVQYKLNRLLREAGEIK